MFGVIVDGQDYVVLATLSAGVVSAAATATVTSWRARRTASHLEEVRHADIVAFLDGVPAVPGVTEGAQNAALRMAKVETGLSEIARGQSVLEKRMDEANGTGRRTEQMVREIRDHLGMAS